MRSRAETAERVDQPRLRATSAGAAQEMGEVMAFNQETAEIYALCCPDSGEVRYIGKAKCAKSRLKQHLREMRRSTPVYKWIASLRKIGASPQMVVLMSAWDWRNAEKDVIAQSRADGLRLLNIADGGDEPYCSKEQRAENGRKTAKMVHTDPVRRRIWLAKKMVSEALRRGHLNEETKAKLRLAAAKNPKLFGAWAGI